MPSVIKVRDKWRAQVRRKGHAPQCRTFAKKSQADKWARELEAAIDAGTPAQALTAHGRGLTVAGVDHEYRKLRDGTARPIGDASNEHYMLRHLARLLGDRAAASLVPADLVGYCKARRDEGAGPYTLNMEMSKLGTALRYVAAALHLQLPSVVADARPLLAHLGLIGGGGRRERRPTEDELTAIVAHLTAKRGQLYADVVLFAVATAMRRSEIARIRWPDVDEAKRLVLVRGRKDPRRKDNDQWVPLLPAAWEVLQEQPREAGAVRIFPVDLSTVSKYFTWACRELGIPDLHFHDLRHEGTSRLFEEGFGIQQVALVTGHRDWRHLRRYTNLRPEDVHRGPAG